MIAWAPTKHSSPITTFSSTRAPSRMSLARPTTAPRRRAAGPDVHVVVHDAALELGVGLHDDVGAEHRVGPQHRAGFDPGVVADQHRAVDLGVGREVGALPQPHTFADLEARDVELHPAVEDVLVRPAVRLERADVLPVAVDHVPEQLLAVLEHRREHVAREVDDLALGDEVEDLGLEHVDVRVDRVGEDLAPGGLLEEPLDRAVFPGDDDAELDRVLHPLQRDRRERVGGAVRLHDRAEVDVGQCVAGDDEERLVELVHRVAHRTGGAERRLLGGVPHAHAELGAVAEVVADVVREERDRHDDVVEAVLGEQPDDVLHHRRVRDRHHRLRLVARQRAEPCALAAGQDDSLHEPTSVGTLCRSVLPAARCAPQARTSPPRSTRA